MPDLPDQLTERAVAPSVLLAGQVAALRHRQVRAWVATGGARVVIALGLFLGTGMLLDWWLDLPWAVRALFLALDVGVLTWLLVNHVLKPLVRQPDDDTFALMVEKARPEFRTRLIASLQLTRPGALEPGAASAVVQAMGQETEDLARPLQFSEVARLDEFKRYGSWAAVVLVAGLMLFAAGGQTSLDLLKRALLATLPVPRKTRVFCLTRQVRLGRGDSVTIEAMARGHIPNSGRLFVRSSFMREREYPMERGKQDPTLFSRTVENVQSSFTYYVRLNDGESDRYEVRVIPRPIITRMDCEQIPPPYSKLPQARRALGDLSLLAGSRLRFRAEASKDLRSATLRLVGLTNDLPVAIQPERPRELTGDISIPARGLTGFSVQMTDTEGMESKDAAVYGIEIVPDRVPAVRIVLPDRKEELVTRDATLLLAFQARDDFQIARVRLRYKLVEPEDAEIKAVEMELGTNALAEIRHRFEWKLGELKPLLFEGNRLEFWVEAEDNNDVTGPGIGASDHQLLRVVTAEEKRADLLNRAGDYLGTIGDVTGDQERLNQNLGTLILEKRP